MAERIPEEELAVNRLRFKRQVAGVILDGLRETGLSFEDLDDRLDQEKGTAQKYFMELVTGEASDFDVLADMAYACGYEVKLKAEEFLVRQASGEGDEHKV